MSELSDLVTPSMLSAETGLQYHTLFARIKRHRIPHQILGHTMVLKRSDAAAILFDKKQSGRPLSPKYSKKLKGTWRNMMERCYNDRNTSYPFYGLRGIKVCLRWQTFAHFAKDMGEPPEGHTLDRKNPNRNYSKRNCEWVPSSAQGKNKRGAK